ncbi:S41 family peptidase [bacterium]|nr:S41 family peptidase [bacterium]
MTNENAKKNSFFNRSVSLGNAIVLGGIVLLFGLGIGAASSPLRNYVTQKITCIAPSGDLSKKDFSLYWEVYTILRDKYVDPSKLDAGKLFYGSIKGLVESLGDSPTVFFDPKETEEYKKSQSGTYSGIGAELDSINKSGVVVAPFDGSPAAQAGLEPQDIIIEVDGVTTHNKTLLEVVSKIRGEAGTKVKLTIVRPRENNKKYELEITRGSVNAPSMARGENVGNIAVVKISRFTESTLTEWVSRWNVIASGIATEYNNGKVTGLVIDLRNNPGGYFDAAVILAGDFLPKGTIIAYQREKSGDDETFPTATEPRLKDISVTILVNGSSASASEIFAGAMQYYKRATIIGEKTYGKGTAQIVLPVSDGSSLHVTVSKWLLPSKEWLNPDNPIIPNKEVDFNYEQKAKGVDNQMDEAIKELKK